jgi:glucosamine-6-phosphate deaminase
MEPLGADLRELIPFREEQACARVRAIRKQELTHRGPQHHDEFHVRVIEEPAQLYEALATNMLRRIKQAAEEQRPFVGVFPVGPVGQYERIAQKILVEQVSLEHVTLFFMDEYAHEDGTPIDKASPWSLEHTAHRHLLSLIPDAGLPPERIHFPGPGNIERYDEMVMEASEGHGADVVYGGIGWSGHFAFWEPHLWETFADEEAWKQGHSAFVRLHPMSILHNSLRAGGDWSSVPPCAYTAGPGIVLGARYRSFWLDAHLGGGMSWQRFIGRLATHGPVTPLVPASYLQTLPGDVVFLGAVAEDIAGPKASWQ